MRDTTSTINGELDPDLDRYASAIRRSWYKVLIAAGLLGVVFAFVFGSSSSTTTVTLQVDQATEPLAPVGLDVAYEEIPSTVGARDVLCRPVEGISDDSCTAILDPTTPEVIIFTTGGDSNSAAADQSALRLQTLTDWIGDQRKAATAAPLELNQQQRQQVQARLDELDAEIAALPGSQALRDAYLDERADLTTALLKLDDQQRALQSFSVDPSRVRVLSSSTSSTDTRILWLIVGIVVGLLVGFAAVVVRAHFDRRIRSRGDLDRLLGTPPMPVVPRSGPERELALTALAAALSRDRGARGSIALVIERPTEAEVAKDLASRVDGAEAITMSDLPQRIEAGDPAVIIAASGGAHNDDLARVGSYLEALGCRVVGGVLVDVPARSLRQAMA